MIHIVCTELRCVLYAGMLNIYLQYIVIWVYHKNMHQQHGAPLSLPCAKVLVAGQFEREPEEVLVDGELEAEGGGELMGDIKGG